MAALERHGTARALFVMDEPLANLVRLALQHLPLETKIVPAGRVVTDLVKQWRPHLILCDLDRDGHVLSLAGERLPVIVMTRQRNAQTKLDAFDRGAHDLIEVPFSPAEIVARSAAAIRRAHGIRLTVVPRIRLGHLQSDLLKETVRVGEESPVLSPLQQGLLYLLAANAGRVLSREQILNELWAADMAVESNVVDRHIRDLRVKLRDDWRKPRFVETVARAGYRFIIPS